MNEVHEVKIIVGSAIIKYNQLREEMLKYLGNAYMHSEYSGSYCPCKGC